MSAEMRTIAIACVVAVVLAGAAWAATRDGRAVTYEACLTDETWARQQVNAILSGGKPKPYRPYDGRRVVEAFRRAGFALPTDNKLLSLHEAGLAIPDLCDFRWFSETNPFDLPAQAGQGQLRVMVVATPANAAFEYKERLRLAAKYDYAHAVRVLRKGNVVVEYYVKFPDGSTVRHNRLADVGRVLAGLK